MKIINAIISLLECVKQFTCSHKFMLMQTPTRLSVVCYRCGMHSRGISVGEKSHA